MKGEKKVSKWSQMFDTGPVQVTHITRCCGFTNTCAFLTYFDIAVTTLSMYNTGFYDCNSAFTSWRAFLLNVCSDVNKWSVITQGNKGYFFSPGCFSFPVWWNTKAPKHESQIRYDMIAIKCKHNPFFWISKANKIINSSQKPSQYQNMWCGRDLRDVGRV